MTIDEQLVLIERDTLALRKAILRARANIADIQDQIHYENDIIEKYKEMLSKGSSEYEPEGLEEGIRLANRNIARLETSIAKDKNVIIDYGQMITVLEDRRDNLEMEKENSKFE